MSALSADADVAATFFGFAADDGVGGFPLYVGLMAVFSAEGIVRSAENILDSEIRHGRHLPTGQRGL